MLHVPLWKRILILGLCAVGVFFALPNLFTKQELESFPAWFPKHQLVLGLDLQGGAHLLLEVDFDTVLKEQMAALVDGVRTTLRKENVGYTQLRATNNQVTFQLRDINDQERALKTLRQMDRSLDVAMDNEGTVILTLTPQAIQERKISTLKQSIEIVRRRVDETGTAEPIIQQQGEDRILVQLPGLEDPARIKNLLGQTAKLHFRMVEGLIAPGTSEKVTPGTEILEDYHPEKEGRTKYLVQKRILVSGENLVDAQPAFDQYNRPVVSFKFDSLGAKKFGDATKVGVGKPFAIVLDNKVISAPRINEPILGGSGQISGNFTLQEAQDLALLMRAGALPAPLKVLEERTVGPGLGADSIAAGEKATVIAVLLIVAFMLLAYYFFGLVANIAMTFNLILLVAMLSLTGATLTLPGIAGIALTLGMAVDANVLIYERIKEEIRNGKKILSAVDAGYNRAMATIIDSNLTTLIGGALLYQFGTGPVKGFAVTLAFGIIISMFTAITLTRLIIVYWLKWRKPQKLFI